VQSGAWNNAATWAGGIPVIDSPSDVVTIPEGIQVYIPAEYPVDASFGMIEIVGELVIQSTVLFTSGTLTNHGSLFVNLSGTLQIEGVDSIFRNDGYMLNQGLFEPGIWSEFYNEGVFENFGTFDIRPRCKFYNEADGYFTNDGFFEMGNLASARNAGTIINRGDIEFSYFRFNNVPSPVLNNVGGTFTNAGDGNMLINGRIFNGTFDQQVSVIRNYGTIILDGEYFANRGTGRSIIDNFGHIDSSYGRFEVSAASHGNDNHVINWPDAVIVGRLFVPAGRLVNHDGASIEIPTGKRLLVEGEGVVDNDSGIFNSGEINNTGTIANRCNGFIQVSPGTYSGNPVADWCDTTPPVITPAISGSLGNNGWYRTNVGISWSVTDPETPVTSMTGCDPSTLLTDNAGVNYQCEATSIGGTTSRTVFIKRDATRPSASVLVTPPANSEGWNNSSISVSFSGTDALSGLASCTATTVLTSEGAGQSASGGCEDNAGNLSHQVIASGINIDKTAPLIAFGGNLAVYSVTDTVEISCSVTDALSGLVSSVCPSASGRGFDFSLDSANILDATALDRAGNSSSASTTFQIVVQPDGVRDLVDEFIENKTVVKKIHKAMDKIETERKTKKRNDLISALESYLQKLVGKERLTLEQSEVLLDLLRFLYS